jgi:RNA polymerase sigma-70 factor (ECF subfamily)
LKTSDATTRFQADIWPHADAVLRTALYLVHSPADAEDLAQETMLKAFASLDRLREGTNPKAWLMTILRNTRIDRLRAAKSRPDTVSLDEMPFEPADAPTASSERWDRPEEILDRISDERLIEALRDLPEEIRWTLLLVDVEGMDHKEAAAVLDVPVGTIKSRAHRGRAMLKESLTPRMRLTE